MILKEDIINEYLTGKSINDLAQIYDMSYSYIRNILLKNNIQIRNRTKLRADRLEKYNKGICKRCPNNREKDKVYCSQCINLYKIQGKLNRTKCKIDTFNHYGGAICRCCGETNLIFLTLDHINNNGSQHRKQLSISGKGCGKSLYDVLKKNNYPEGYQVLCWNCNSGKHINNGICPHKTEQKQFQPFTWIC